MYEVCYITVLEFTQRSVTSFRYLYQWQIAISIFNIQTITNKSFLQYSIIRYSCFFLFNFYLSNFWFHIFSICYSLICYFLFHLFLIKKLLDLTTASISVCSNTKLKKLYQVFWDTLQVLEQHAFNIKQAWHCRILAHAK